MLPRSPQGGDIATSNRLDDESANKEKNIYIKVKGGFKTKKKVDHRREEEWRIIIIDRQPSD